MEGHLVTVYFDVGIVDAFDESGVDGIAAMGAQELLSTLLHDKQRQRSNKTR